MFFAILESLLIVEIIKFGAPDNILLESLSKTIPSAMLTPYSSNTLLKLGVLILFTFGSASISISPPLFMYSKIKSLSFAVISSFKAVITISLQSSGILPFTNKSINSTSFASVIKEPCRYWKYSSPYTLCPSMKYILGFTFVITSKIAFVIASSVVSTSSYVL